MLLTFLPLYLSFFKFIIFLQGKRSFPHGTQVSSRQITFSGAARKMQVEWCGGGVIGVAEAGLVRRRGEEAGMVLRRGDWCGGKVIGAAEG